MTVGLFPSANHFICFRSPSCAAFPAIDVAKFTGEDDIMARSSFTIDRVRGGQLSGWLETPETTPRGWAIFAHCFTCGKESRAAVHISRALSRAGIGVLRFDFAGAGSDDRTRGAIS